MRKRKIDKLMKHVARALADHGPHDTLSLYKRLRADGVRLSLRDLKDILSLMRQRRLIEPTRQNAALNLTAEVVRDFEANPDEARAKIKDLLAQDGYAGPALETALQLQVDTVELLRANGPMPRARVLDHLEAAGWTREYLEAEVCDPSELPVDTRRSFPIYDRGVEPPVALEDLQAEIADMVGDGDDLPFRAFISGPGTNLRVDFDEYDAAKHKAVVAGGLMDLIRQGADRIVTVSEIWLREDGMPKWDGVMILEATRDGDTLHMAPFEGRSRLGPWETAPGVEGGSLSRLFARAESAP
jgi:hypothetical protein